MTSSEDTEITLGTGKLLVLFFSLVAICALFFALGYSLGRKSEPGITTASAAVTPQSTSATGKTGSGSGSTPPMTFYKSVEQKDANPELTPAADTKTGTAAATTNANPAAGPANASAANGASSNGSPANPANGNPAQTAAGNAPDSTTTLPTGGYFVQVAAVSKQEDADALVEALKKKDYPAFVAAVVPTDKLFRVQLGPFVEIKDADAMRARLIGDGYNPIVKK